MRSTYIPHGRRPHALDRHPRAKALRRCTSTGWGAPAPPISRASPPIPTSTADAAVIVDLFGHGFSDRPKTFAGTLEAHAEAVAALLDHCEVKDAVLIGHSMGGSIAIILAAARPELSSRVIVAEPNLRAGGGLYSGAIAAYREEDFVSHGFRTVLAGLEPDYAARVRAADPAILHRSAVSLVSGTAPGTAELFFGLPQPRVMILGARSRPYEDERDVRQAGIPVVEVRDAGHHMMRDNPAGFVAALVDGGAVPTAPRSCQSGAR